MFASTSPTNRSERIRLMADFNAQVIEEFRANGGTVGGMFQGAHLLLLTTTGRKTGRKVVSPLVYSTDGDDLVVAGSKGGADTHPVWYLNIEADPRVHVEVGGDAYDAVARIPERTRRDRLYAAHAARMPQFSEYAANTDRLIPVVVLSRA